MDTQELRRLRAALWRYLKKFDCCIRTPASRRTMRTYVAGQLGPLERKSLEPIALQAGVKPRTLQAFLSQYRWNDAAVARRHREMVRKRHGSDQAITVIDETSFQKKGTKTPGVQRQYCGSLGKVENCTVSVHLGYVAGDFHALLDGELFLPESWANDRARCRAASIPDEVGYRPKWRIALELIERSRDEGVPMKWLTADEGYGRAGAFRRGVAQLGLRYVVEIPCHQAGWTPSARWRPPRTVQRLGAGGGPPWNTYRVKDTDKGPVVWQAREWRFIPQTGEQTEGELRLIVAREVLTGEHKYFLSNAAPETPITELLCVAFSRWHIERLFEEGKGEVGLDHFEVRNYRSLRRHLVLSMLSLYFLAEQCGRLRGEKSVVDLVPGAGGADGATGAGPAAPGADPPPGEDGAPDRTLAAAQRPSFVVCHEATAS